MNDKIRELQAQIKTEEARIRDCKHEFGSTYYNAETIMEPSSYEQTGRGVDKWYVPTSYREISKDRWSRKCAKCGHEQHTYK